MVPLALESTLLSVSRCDGKGRGERCEQRGGRQEDATKIMNGVVPRNLSDSLVCPLPYYSFLRPDHRSIDDGWRPVVGVPIAWSRGEASRWHAGLSSFFNVTVFT